MGCVARDNRGCRGCVPLVTGCPCPHTNAVTGRYQKELRFKQKLKAELVALKQRIASGSAEQKRQRQVDTER